MNPKFELLKDDFIVIQDGKIDRKLFRIRAKMDLIPWAKKGDIGGYVESEYNLSFKENSKAWIMDNAKVYGSAKVLGNACVSGKSKVFQDALVCQEAVVHDCIVFGYAVIEGKGCLEDCFIKNHSRLGDNGREYDMKGLRLVDQR